MAASEFGTTVEPVEASTSNKVIFHPELPDVLVVCGGKVREELKRSEKEVIVDRLCGTAILRGSDIYAPGILAAHPGTQNGDEISVYADLDGKCRRGLTKKYQGRKYFVGNGIATIGRAELFKNSVAPSGIAVKMTASLYSLPTFHGLDPTFFFPQNLPSVVVSHVLDPQSGERILDMCAAPGGKTTHIGNLIENQGLVIAIDKTPNKVEKLRRNCDQQRLTCVKCFAFDSTKLCAEDREEDKSESYDRPPFLLSSFDRVLLDPPCSALGQRPQFSHKMSSKELASYPVYQRKLFMQAVKLLRPNGILIYSTCTLTVEENENQVAWALKHFPELSLLNQKPYLGRPGLYGLELDDDKCELVQRFDPFISLRDRDASLEIDDNPIMKCNRDTIGFFIAKFVKIPR